MMTLQELERLSETDLEKADPGSLVDIGKIRIDPSMPTAQRMLSYLEQVRNPYCFLCGETPVKVCFSPGGGSLEKKLKTYFSKLNS